MNFITLTAEDHYQLAAFEAKPAVSTQSAIIVLHEIFGVTSFIKEVCAQWAEKGYQTVAPSLYDRFEKNIVIPYNEDGYEQALSTKEKALNWEKQLLDIDAAKRYLLSIGITRISIVGFSWGATLGWLSACRLKDISCVCLYSGTHIFQFINESPKCPALLHFADKDELVPREHVEQIHRQHPEATIYTYPATHAFYCTGWKKYDTNNSENVLQRYDPDLARVANKRTEEFIKTYRANNNPYINV